MSALDSPIFPSIRSLHGVCGNRDGRDVIIGLCRGMPRDEGALSLVARGC